VARCLYLYGLPAFPAGLKSHVAISEFHTDLFEKGARRLATGKDKYVIVGNFASAVIDLQQGFIALKLSGQ